MPTHNLFYAPGSFIRQFQGAKIPPPFFVMMAISAFLKFSYTFL